MALAFLTNLFLACLLWFFRDMYILCLQQTRICFSGEI